MAIKSNPTTDIFSVSEFQTSGLPYVTSSVTTGTSVNLHSFSKVSKSFTVHNTESSSKKLRIGFTLNGVNGGNHFIIDSAQMMTFDAKVKEIYIRADVSNTITYSIYAALTTIPSSSMPFLSGTLQDGSSGWSGVG